MTTWFVSRHEGALQWMQLHGPAYDRHVAHLSLVDVQPGDHVIGTLPVHMAAQVCDRGASYWHLMRVLPAESRGRDLSAQELYAMDAKVQRFDIRAR